MGRVVAFPASSKAKLSAVQTTDPAPVAVAPADNAHPSVLGHVFSVAWILFLLAWPFVQWIVAFDIVFQFLRALYYWNTPGVYAGFAFLIHLIGGGAVFYCVATRRL